MIAPHRIAQASLLLAALLPGAAYAETITGTFNVTMEITSTCLVQSGIADLDFGSHPASDTNISGSTVLQVACAKDTPFNIGLAPSNDDDTGAGVMSGTGGNTDTVPYQLRQGPALLAPVWGNTATAADVGNGVAGTGSGALVDYPVYGTVASANYTPGTYSDIVTVNVNF